MSGHAVIRSRSEMVRLMHPTRVAGRFVFQSMPAADLAQRLGEIRGLFVEDEGISVIVPAHEGDADVMAQITLQVPSALDGVGLTAAVSTALADAGVPCNIVAALHHDHVFVPEGQADTALEILHELSRSGVSDTDV